MSASQTAPPDHSSPTTNQLLSLPANPLLDATVARASAQARAIPAGGCPAVGQPIATSSSELADASVINGTLGSPGSALVALDNSQGATVNATGSVELHAVPGQTTDGVVSTATTQLTAVTLFRGTPQALTINVVAPPVVTRHRHRPAGRRQRLLQRADPAGRAGRQGDRHPRQQDPPHDAAVRSRDPVAGHD